jgi:glutamate carboxypeptidase
MASGDSLRFKRAIVCITACLSLNGIAHAQLSETEQRTPAALELLEKSVRINSGTLNPEGVRAVGEIYRAELDALGFKTRWIDMPPATKRAGHLVATHDGGPGKRVLLLGYLDTVFEKASSVPLWERQGDRVHGQGVNDMKGGDVIMIEALRALKSVVALDRANVEIMFTGDAWTRAWVASTSSIRRCAERATCKAYVLSQLDLMDSRPRV